MHLHPMHLHPMHLHSMRLHPARRLPMHVLMILSAAFAPLLSCSPDGPVPIGPSSGSPVLSDLIPPDAASHPSGPQVRFLSPSGPLDALPTQIVAIFDQPMVALGADPNAQGVPIELDPPVLGRGYWVGTRIAVLVPQSPLRYATSYAVRVPAHATAPTGLALGRDFTANFETPRPEPLRIHGPSEDPCIPLQTFVVAFDQPVAPSALERVARFRVHDRQNRVVRVRASVPATPDERAALAQGLGAPSDEAAWQSGHLIALRPAEALPLDTAFDLEVPAGLIGRLGPLPSTKSLQGAFRTYGPLRVASQSCTTACDPDNTFVQIEFTTPVCEVEFRARVLVDDQPQSPLDPQQLQWAGCSRLHHVPIADAGGGTHRLTLPGEMTDVHGQTLDHPENLTFSFGHRRPFLARGFSGNIIETAGPRLLPFRVLNAAFLRAEVATVPRSHLVRALVASQTVDSDLSLLPVQMQVLEPALRALIDREETVSLDVSQVLPPGRMGPVLYRARSAFHFASRPGDAQLSGLVQFTDLAVTAKVADSDSLLWVTSLSTGQPVPNARVQIRSRSDRVLWEKTTGADGRVQAHGATALVASLLPIDRSPSPSADEPSTDDDDPWYEDLATPLDDLFVVTESGDDALVMPLSGALQDWESREWSEGGDDHWRASLVLDRDVYREGETVRIKGWVRQMTADGPRCVPGGTGTIRIRAPSSGDFGSRREAEAIMPVFFDAFGAFDATYTVPTGARHGFWQAALILPHRVRPVSSAPFAVQFFEVPEFKVTASLNRPHYIRGDQAAATVLGSYYFGAPMARAPVKAIWSWAVTDYAPPGYPGFRFDDEFGRDASGTRTGATDDTTADATGTARFEQLQVPPFRRPVRLEFEGEVQDTTGRTISALATAMVHPAQFYLGTRMRSFFVDVHRDNRLDVVAVTPEGAAHSLASVDVTVSRREWHTVRKKGVGTNYWYSVSESVDTPLHREVMPLMNGTGTVTFVPDRAGLFVFSLAAVDAQGQRVTTEAAFHAIGPGDGPWEASDDSRVRLTADKAQYAPGETARILIQSPFPRGHALVTIERQTVTWQKVIALNGTSTSVDIPVGPEAVPNVSVAAVVVQGRTSPMPPIDADLPDLGAPAARLGAIRLAVSPASNHLAVTLSTPTPQVRPKDPVQVDIEVRDADGRPVKAQVLLMAVDAAILDLTGYVLRDPFDIMFAPLNNAVRTAQSHHLLFRKDLYGDKSDDGGDGGSELRRDFVAVAFYDPSILTDDNGRATVRFAAPDNLTRFRLMAVAAAPEARFGATSSAFTVNRPLMVRPSVPPFLEAGDRFQLAAFVHGSPGVEGTARVTLEAEGILSATSPLEQTVDVGETRPGEARFDLHAVQAGTGIIRLKATLGTVSDAIEIPIEALRRDRVLTVAVTGEAEAQVIEPVAFPIGAAPDVGGLSITASSTALVGLSEASRYLLEYPYGCLEQQASRLLPIILMGDLAQDFGFGLTDDLRAAVQKTLDALPTFQVHEGGFRWWADMRPTSADPYLTAYVLHVAGLAQKSGFRVDDRVLSEARQWLGTALRRRPDDKRVPPLSADEAAFVVWVLGSQKEPIADIIPVIASERSRLGRVSKSFLLAAVAGLPGQEDLVDSLVRDITAGVAVKASEVLFPEADTQQRYQGLARGDVATTAAAILALTAARPDSPLLAGLVAHLMAVRSDGRWQTTHENGLALLALTEWYSARERTVPDFRLTPWVGDTPLATWTFHGRDLSAAVVQAPTWTLPLGQVAPVTLAREGIGHMHYAIRLRTSIPGPKPARDQGIQVTRVVTTPDLEPVTAARRGEAVVLALSLATPTPLRHLIVDVPVPAGLSPVNLEFVTSSEALRRKLERLAFGSPTLPCVHQAFLQDRVLCYVDKLDAGVHRWLIPARAVIPGTFAFPAAYAEEMYAPETFGSSDATVFEIR